MKVAPDVVSETDNQLLFKNHHFEFKRDNDFAWFNYLDLDYNFVQIELKLPRNKYGQFDKAILGEPNIIEIVGKGLNSPPSRFARFGSIVVFAYEE